MNRQAALFVGIAARGRRLTLASIASGRAAIETSFPETPLSAETIRVYLCDHDGPVTLAVDGALIDLALRWGRSTSAATMLVPSEPTAPAASLAQVARRSR